MLKEPKRIIAEEPQSPDRWLKEPRNNHPVFRCSQADPDVLRGWKLRCCHLSSFHR